MAANMDALLKIRAQVEGQNNIVGLSRGLASVEATAKGVTGAMRGMTGAAAGLSGALGSLTPLLSVAGLVGLAKGALDAGDAMNDLSMRTGVSVEVLGRFKKAAAVSGTDIEGVSKSLVKLSKTMLDASVGGKESVKTFAALGISVKNQNGTLKSADAVMLEVANRFKAMPDGVAKTALALRLFGRAGAEMIPMLNMGGDAIAKLDTKMTTAFARKADEYKDSLARLSGKVGALGMDISLALLPTLEALTNAVSSAVGAINKLPEPAKNFAMAGTAIAIAWGPATSVVRGALAVFVSLTAAETASGAAAAASVPQYGAASAAMTGATAAGARLVAVLSRLAAIGVVTVGVNYISNVVGAGMSVRQLQDRDRRGGAAADFAGATRQQVIEAQQKQRANLARLQAQDAQRRKNIANNPFSGFVALFGGAPFMAAEQESIALRSKYARGVLGLDPNNFRNAIASGLDGFNPDLNALGAGGGAGGGGKGKKDNTQQIQKGIAAAREAYKISQAELAILKEMDPLKKVDLEYQEKKRTAQSAASQELAGALSIEQQAYIQRKLSVDLAKLDIEQQRALTDEYKKQGEAAREKLLLGVTAPDQLRSGGFQKGVDEYVKGIGTMQDALAGLSNEGFKGVENALMELMTTGRANFQQFAASILADTARMIVQQLVLKSIMQALGFLGGGINLSGVNALGPSGAMNLSGLSPTGSTFGLGSLGGGFSFSGFNAKGNIYARNGIVPFANGGIVTGPTIFPFAKGIGLMGEAGPEAIMPLKRGRDGKLGVAGGGGVAVTVNVDANSSSVAGNNNQANALGKAVASAVQAEIIKQKRPGGLLA